MRISVIYYGKVFGGRVVLNIKNSLPFSKQSTKTIYQWDSEGVPIKTIKTVFLHLGYISVHFWWIIPYEY